MANRLPKPLRVSLQVVAYATFAAFIGYFSSAPAYRQLGDNEAVLKLSFSHPAQLKFACRTRSDAELAKLGAEAYAEYLADPSKGMTHEALWAEIEADQKPE